MAISVATLRTRVKERVAAHLSTPVINDLQNSAIDSWAQQGATEVINMLKRPNVHYKDLIVNESTLTISSGSASLPGNYFHPISVVIDSDYTGKSGDTVTITKRNVRILDDSEDFSRFDNTNFLLKVDGKRPICYIGDKIYFKPTSGIDNGKFTYIKNHPVVSSNGTKFSDTGDNLLILYIMKRYYLFLEEPGLVGEVKAEMEGVVNGA